MTVRSATDIQTPLWPCHADIQIRGPAPSPTEHEGSGERRIAYLEWFADRRSAFLCSLHESGSLCCADAGGNLGHSVTLRRI